MGIYIKPLVYFQCSALLSCRIMTNFLRFLQNALNVSTIVGIWILGLQSYRLHYWNSSFGVLCIVSEWDIKRLIRQYRTCSLCGLIDVIRPGLGRCFDLCGRISKPLSALGSSIRTTYVTNNLCTTYAWPSGKQSSVRHRRRHRATTLLNQLLLVIYCAIQMHVSRVQQFALAD